MRGPTGAPSSPAALAGTKTATLIAAWLSAMESEKRAATVATWELYGRTHWIPFFRDAAEFASERRLAAYVAARLKHASGATVAKECSALQTLLGWCTRADVAYLATAPTVPRPPKSAGKRVLTKIRVDMPPEQIEALIEALPETVRRRERGVGEPRPCRALFRVLWETGLRIGTLRRIEAPRDYHRGAAELVIRGEADKADFGRTVPLTARARAALDAICPDEGLIFPEINLRTQLRTAALAAGVPGHLAGHVSHHDFRHGRATHLLDSGAPLPAVSYLLGHKQATTTNLYVHAHAGHARRAIAALDSGHQLGHGAEKADGALDHETTKALEKPGLSELGHGGLEPPANGLRVQRNVALRGVLQGFLGSRDASKTPETTLSGHGVPAIERIAEALERALIARREGSPHAWDRVVDAAEIVAAELERMALDEEQDERRRAAEETR